MKKIFIMAIVLLFPFYSIAQDSESDSSVDLLNSEIEKNSIDSTSDEDESNAIEEKADKISDENNNEDNLNLDMQILYGLYNHMDSGINISMEHEDFVYLLRSDFKRSNDYGYKGEIFQNSGYYSNKFEFTGNTNLPLGWKNITDIKIDNDSLGMFSNPDYSREDRDKIFIKTKSIKKIGQKFEGYFTLNYNNYQQRLVPKEGIDVYKTNIQNFLGENGGEIIWSASNRIKYNLSYNHYNYPDEKNDYNISGNIIDDFKIHNYFGISVGINAAYNRDVGYLAYSSEKYEIPIAPIVGFSLKGMKYTSFNIVYKYSMEPFRPEELYFQQNFLYPVYELDASEAHDVSYKFDFNYKDVFSFNLNGSAKKYENYISFYNLVNDNSGGEGNLLSATGFPAIITDNHFNMEIVFIEDVFSVMADYNLFYSHAKKNVIYHPMHEGGVTLKLSPEPIIIEWKNSYHGETYINLEDSDKMDDYFIGELNFQYLTVDSLYIFIRVENLYNKEYYFREGYPRAGVSALFGLGLIK